MEQTVTVPPHEPLTTPHATHQGGHREVWNLAYPIVLATISETLMNATDTFMVARLGTVEVAAVGLASMMTWLFYLPFLGLAMGINTFVAQSYGAKAYRECGRMTWQGLSVAVVSGLFILSGILLGPVLFDLARPSPEVQRLGVSFFQIRLFDGPGLMVAMTIASFLRGIGDTKTPMKIGIGTNLLNLGLNYVLIYGHLGFPRLGVRGSALGSAIAGLASGLVYVAIFFHPRYAEFGSRQAARPVWPDLRRVLRVGVPIGVQRFLDIGSFVIFSALIGRLGDAQLAANQIGIQLMSVSYTVGIGIAAAATVLVGQYIGAKNLAAAERSAYSAVKLAIVYMGVVGVGFVLFPGTVIAFFNQDPDVIRFGREALIAAAFFQVFDACGLVFSGALRGAGDTRWTMVAALIGAWVFFLPLAYFLALPLGLGFLGAWLGATAYICVLGLACFYRFRRGAWKRMVI
ncbi:MAG: MATE family efflux transporter [Candidatus Latescibacteria bacterium]|nr:MATE family efflux transporter [Candidatus Latescibacterota bacterium]